MRHIAIDARIINSGTGTYVLKLLQQLEKLDSENNYSVLVPSKDMNYWQPTGSNFKLVACDYDNYSFGEQFGFRRFLNKLKPDLVHFCMPQQPIFYRGKTVTTFHDLSLLRIYNSDKNWLVYHAKQLVGKFVFKRVAQKTDQIIVPTDFVKNDVAETLNVSTDKITRSYEAAEVKLGSLKPFKHPFKRFIIYVGQQSDYKNIPRLAEAHQSLLDKHPELGLILVGRLNKGAQMNKQLFESRDYKNILFTDFLPDEQRDWLYQQAVAYVFPSLTEGFGLPALEAMAYGAPVVSSNATCLPEVLGQAAHYFDPLDTIDIARAINDVITSDELQAELMIKGKTQYKKYSWRRMAQETKQVYEQVLNQPEK